MSNELANFGTANMVDREDFIGQFHSQTLMYTSMTAETEAEKKAMFNLMNAPQDRLADKIGETIKAENIYIEVVELERKDDKGNLMLNASGEPILQKAPRIIIVDPKGKGYQCVSVGILGSLKKMQMLYGPFPWTGGRDLKVKQINKGTRRILTLEL